jgi:hypothetical protein
MLKPCLTCGRPSAGAYCAEHDQDDARRNAKTRAHGVKRAHFQRLRAQRLELAGRFCELTIDADCTREATTVHLDPALEGNHDAATIDDVRAACLHCHGVVDGARSHDTHEPLPPGRAIFNTPHSPALGSKNPRTSQEASSRRPDGVVIA